jgi:hypothetical protein
MVDMANNSGCTVRVIVKLRPDQYDELIRHVREIGCTRPTCTALFGCGFWRSMRP